MDTLTYDTTNPLAPQEDSIRCVTLVARDILNLNIAFGGRLELGPVWEALAARIKCAPAADRGRAAAGRHTETSAAMQPHAWFTPCHSPHPLSCRVAKAAAAADAGEEPAAEPATAPAAAPQPEPQPLAAQGVGARRGRRRALAPPKPPPGPAVLQVVQEAVAADPVRSGWLKKTEAQWKFKLTARNIQVARQAGAGGGRRCMPRKPPAASRRRTVCDPARRLPASAPCTPSGQGIEAVKGRWNAKNLSELAVRAAAHARWGDEARLRAAQQASEERSARARETFDARRAKERAEREEELAYRCGGLAWVGVGLRRAGAAAWARLDVGCAVGAALLGRPPGAWSEGAVGKASEDRSAVGNTRVFDHRAHPRRLLEEGLPTEMEDLKEAARPGAAHYFYELESWLGWGYAYRPLADLLGKIATEHRRKERARLLDEGCVHGWMGGLRWRMARCLWPCRRCCCRLAWRAACLPACWLLPPAPRACLAPCMPPRSPPIAGPSQPGQGGAGLLQGRLARPLLPAGRRGGRPAGAAGGGAPPQGEPPLRLRLRGPDCCCGCLRRAAAVG